MNRNGIGATILSLSSPATLFLKDRAESASLCREVNEYVASIRDEQPSRFGFFATLPSLHDTSAALEEVAFAFDVLKAEGVTLMTSYGKSYLGHPDFRPIWEDLNRRGAVVFIHPAANLSAGALEDPYVAPPLVDYPHETTRTAVHLIMSNTVRDNPNCKIILSHGGGTLPYMATRVSHMSSDSGFADKTAELFAEEARRFYYDLALTAFDYPFDLLQKFAQPGHILYGSDFPFARDKTNGTQIAFLNQCAMTEEAEFSIRRGAALELFPRLRTYERQERVEARPLTIRKWLHSVVQRMIGR